MGYEIMRFIAATVISFFITGIAGVMAGDISQTVVWQSGRDGYHTYRIPALAVATNGNLLAFCEGRKSGSGDAGSIDLLIKRSTDNGKTWSAQQTIWTATDSTCGNPAPVVDRETGRIWLLITWNRGDDHEGRIISGQSKDTRRIFVTSSPDNGQSWEKPREITTDVKLTNWTWYATGPGAGIQIRKGPHAGRLVIPCDHIETGTRHYYSHVIFSDDHGSTWKLGGRSPAHQVNECQVVELADGRLMLNMRNANRATKQRQVAFSDDAGETWKDQHVNTALIEPICQASTKYYSRPGNGGKDLVLFSNPASSSGRSNLVTRASIDDGKTWPLQTTLWPGPAAYSDLAVLHGGQIACLYECGSKNPYENITIAIFSPDDMK